MYNVMIVEDELMVRIGIKNSVKWAEFDMTVVAEAENGNEGYEYFLQHRPEIVITDIRMNIMNGTEMIKKIRAMDKDCFIIVISCLEDFDLLQDIVNCQIFCYLLKATMKISDLEDMLRKIRKKLDSKKPDFPKAEPEKESDVNAAFRQWLQSDGDADYARLASQYPALPPHPKTLLLYRAKHQQDSPLSDLHTRFISDILMRMLPHSVTLCPGDSVFLQLSDRFMDDPEKTAAEIASAVTKYLNVEILCSHRASHCLEDSLKEDINSYLLDSAPYQRHIDKALAYIQRNYCKDISLSDAAAYCGISPNYFSLLFKQKTGESFTKYLNRLRIEKAKILLSQTDLYIYEISDSIGYGDLAYFSKIFKQQTGLSPSEWRSVPADRET